MVSLRTPGCPSRFESATNALVLAIFHRSCNCLWNGFYVIEESCLVGEDRKPGIARVRFFSGMTVVIGRVRPLDVFVDLHTRFADRDERGTLVDPGATVEIIGPLIVLVERGMRMPTKDAVGLMVPRVSQRAVGNFFRETLPTRTEAVEKTRQGLIFRIPFLELQIKQRPEPVIEADILDHEVVELVAVHGDVTQPQVIPLILLVHANPDRKSTRL